MAANLSMDGFEIRIKDGILEMRTEGMRTAGMGLDPERAFKSLVRLHPIEAILFDVRQAHYVLDDLAWSERARIVARMCKSYTTAFICRPDQVDQTRIVLDFHTEFGGRSDQFRSRKMARDWIRARMAENA
jgi:hypothetical protein